MPPLCGMTVLHTTPTLLNAFSSLLPSLLCLFILNLPHSHSPRCLSLGLLTGRPSPGGDGAASYSSSGSSSTDLVIPVYKRSSKLSSASSRCTYSLRNPKSMEVPLCSTSAHLSSFLPSCSILWNTLPASVTSCSSLSSFASSLVSFFVDDKFSFGLPP